MKKTTKLGEVRDTTLSAWQREYAVGRVYNETRQKGREKEGPEKKGRWQERENIPRILGGKQVAILKRSK